MRNLIIILILLFLLHPDKYLMQWNFKKTMTLNAVREGYLFTYENDKLTDKIYEKNIINLTAVDFNDSKISLAGVFKTFSLIENSRYLRLEEIFRSEFSINKAGEYFVPKDKIMPNERSIPTFPTQKIGPGDHWIAKAELFFHMYPTPFYFVTDVDYFFSGIEIKDNKKLGKIVFYYVINNDLQSKLPEDDLSTPVLFWGRVYSIFYWDIEKNLPDTQIEDYRLITIYRNGDNIEFKTQTKTVYDISYPITGIELDTIKDEVEKIIKNSKDASVTISEEGVHIKLGEVNFESEKYKLTGQAKKTLEALVPLLNKYQDHELAVYGYTDNTGSIDFNNKLSEKRAESVVNYLLQLMPEKSDKMYFKGFGALHPIESNDNAAGRSLNRRVEIIIKQSGK